MKVFVSILWCIVALGFSCWPIKAQASGGLYKGECNTDSEISVDVRQAIEKQAMQFVGALLNADPAKAYQVMNSDAKQRMTAEIFASKIKNMPPPDTSFKNIHLTHTYFETMSTVGNSTAFVPCTTEAHGDQSKPDGTVFIEVKPMEQQAYVTAEAESKNNTVAVVLWLTPEQGAWHVGFFKFLPVSLAGRSAGDLWALAQTEQHKNHNLNAFMLGTSALQLADRGPHFHLGIYSDIDKGLNEIHRPDEIQGMPPFNWKLDGKSFKVLHIGSMEAGKKLYLAIRQEIVAGHDEKEADQQNRELISAFAKTFPEYKDAFSGLIIDSVTPEDSKGFRTVQEN